MTSCSHGIYDCHYRDIPPSEILNCADYDGSYSDMEGRLWIVVLSGIVMCAMAFGMGSNDAANSWGTSVGSGAIPLRTAVTIGAMMEFLGAITLGYGVSDTIQKGVSDITDPNCWACGYCHSDLSVYQAGMFGALISTAIFLILSSFTSMPVSATHAVVGGVVGMTAAAVGTNCLNWQFDGLGGIVASWVISPILSGIIGSLTYYSTDYLIFRSDAPRDRALIALPLFITLVTFVITFLICLKSPVTKDQEIWIHFTSSVCVSILALILSILFILPWTKKNLPSLAPIELVDLPESPPKLQLQQQQGHHTAIPSEDHVPTCSPFHVVQDSPINESNMTVDNEQDAYMPTRLSTTASIEETIDAMFCFRILLVCNAALESFAHGSNDTANCTGPFKAVYQIYQHGLDSCHDALHGEWIMIVAGAFVALGVITFGKNVIETIGKNLTMIDYQRGFCIEFSSCVTVVIATMLELPVSTTHCQIGSVVFVGLASMGPKHVSWKLVGKIFLTWMITLPFSGTISIMIMAMIRSAIQK